MVSGYLLLSLWATFIGGLQPYNPSSGEAGAATEDWVGAAIGCLFVGAGWLLVFSFIWTQFFYDMKYLRNGDEEESEALELESCEEVSKGNRGL